MSMYHGESDILVVVYPYDCIKSKQKKFRFANCFCMCALAAKSRLVMARWVSVRRRRLAAGKVRHWTATKFVTGFPALIAIRSHRPILCNDGCLAPLRPQVHRLRPRRAETNRNPPWLAGSHIGQNGSETRQSKFEFASGTSRRKVAPVNLDSSAHAPDRCWAQRRHNGIQHHDGAPWLCQ
jgi:hypothetical protein